MDHLVLFIVTGIIIFGIIGFGVVVVATSKSDPVGSHKVHVHPRSHIRPKFLRDDLSAADFLGAGASGVATHVRNERNDEHKDRYGW